MQRTPLSLLVLLGVVAACLVASSPRVVRAGSDIPLAVIVSTTSKLVDISSSDLAHVFLGERLTDPDGNKLIPFNHSPRTADRVGFDSVVLHMDADTVGRFWIDRKIRGGAGPPRSVESIATLRGLVERLPGAIAYLRPQQTTKEVRVIRVDGKLPEDPSYPVRYRP